MTEEVLYSALFPNTESKKRVTRHQWAEKKASYRSIKMRCQKCGLERNARSDDTHHWKEYRLRDAEWEHKDRTPECLPYMTVRRFDGEAKANAKGWEWNGEKWVKTDSDNILKN